MRAVLLLVAAALASAALLPAAASSHSVHPAATARYGPYTSCPRGFDGTKNIPAMGVWNIEARQITCRTAYRLIDNFPAGLGPGGSYKPYRCRYHYEADGVRTVCTDGRRAFRFNAGGE